MKGLVDILVRYRKLLFLIGMISVLGSLCMMPLPRLSGKLNGFTIENNSDYKRAHELDSLFGGKENIYLEVTPNSDNLKNVLAAVDRITSDLKEQLPQAEISSPKSFYRKMIRHWETKDNSLTSFLKEGREVPVLNQLIARHNTTFLIVIALDHSDSNTAELVDRIIKKEHTEIKHIGALSSAHIESSIKAHVEKDIVLISGLILCLFLGFILIFFRSFHAVVFTFVNIVISLFAALVLFYFLGYEINLISILVIPITLILSMSDALHLLAGYVKNKNIQDKTNRLKKVVNHFIIPSFFSSATTSAAFFSFYLFNDSQYIREFGLISSIALMIEFILTFSVAPFLLYRFDIKAFYGRQLNRVSDFFIKTKKQFTAGFITLIILAIAFAGNLEFHSSPDIFFPSNSEIEEVHESFKKDYYSSIDLKIYVKHIDDKQKPAGNNSLYEYTSLLSDRFESQPNVVSVNSANNQFLFKSKLGVTVDLFDHIKGHNPYFNPNENTYLIQVQFNEARSIIDLKENGLDEILKDAPENIEVLYSSKALLIEDVNKSVASSLIKSLATSGVVIFLMMLILSKSLKTALLSLIPNLVPIAFVVVMYFLFGMHINILTAITAVICLGLLDDDTVHIIYRKIWLKEPMGELSFSILTSALLLSIGFMLFMFSSFQPIRVFGWVSAIIFIVGVVCEMTLMQWVLERVKTKSNL